MKMTSLSAWSNLSQRGCEAEVCRSGAPIAQALQTCHVLGKHSTTPPMTRSSTNSLSVTYNGLYVFVFLCFV